MTAPQTSRKGSWWKWVAFGCGGLVLLAAAFGAFLFFVIQRATAGPQEVVQSFLHAAAAGDYARAHEFFSVPLKEAQPLAKFEEEARRHPAMFKVKDTTFSSRSIDLDGARFEGTVTLEAGTRVPATFRLARENGAWKLIAYSIGE